MQVDLPRFGALESEGQDKSTLIKRVAVVLVDILRRTPARPEMDQVAEDLLPVWHSAPWSPLNPLLHGHQEDAVAQEGHVIDGHVTKVVGHQEHFHHSFVGIK